MQPSTERIPLLVGIKLLHTAVWLFFAGSIAAIPLAGAPHHEVLARRDARRGPPCDRQAPKSRPRNHTVFWETSDCYLLIESTNLLNWTFHATLNGTNPPAGGDKAPAHGRLALLRRKHRSDSTRRCPVPVPMGSRPDWAGTGRVRGSGRESGPLPAD